VYRTSRTYETVKRIERQIQNTRIKYLNDKIEQKPNTFFDCTSKIYTIVYFVKVPSCYL